MLACLEMPMDVLGPLPLVNVRDETLQKCEQLLDYYIDGLIKQHKLTSAELLRLLARQQVHVLDFLVVSERRK